MPSKVSFTVILCLLLSGYSKAQVANDRNDQRIVNGIDQATGKPVNGMGMPSDAAACSWSLDCGSGIPVSEIPNGSFLTAKPGTPNGPTRLQPTPLQSFITFSASKPKPDIYQISVNPGKTVFVYDEYRDEIAADLKDGKLTIHKGYTSKQILKVVMLSIKAESSCFQ